MHPPFFEVHCQKLGALPTLRGVCAGFESGKWRAEQLSRYLMEWLPEFCLSHSERQSINDTNLVSHLRRAAQTVYDTDKYDRRGEFGELLLHALLRETLQTEPAISKIYFKDSVNHTVKGFDAVHVLATPGGLELWLGEVKFYNNASRAVTDVIAELKDHFEDDYLKKEFTLIVNKLDATWPGSEQIKQLLHPHVSLDKVVKAVVVPVLLTYDSPTTKAYSATCERYVQALTTEFERVYGSFVRKNGVTKLRVELFLFPMQSKKQLLSQLHKRLQSAQDL